MCERPRAVRAGEIGDPHRGRLGAAAEEGEGVAAIAASAAGSYSTRSSPAPCSKRMSAKAASVSPSGPLARSLRGGGDPLLLLRFEAVRHRHPPQVLGLVGAPAGTHQTQRPASRHSTSTACVRSTTCRLPGRVSCRMARQAATKAAARRPISAGGDARLVERRADAEAGGAGRDIGGHRLRRDAADRAAAARRREHRLPRLDDGRRQRLAGKSFSAIRAGRERGKRLRSASRRPAGTRRRRPSRRGSPPASECGMTMSRPPASTTRRAASGVMTVPRADQRLVAEPRSPEFRSSGTDRAN